MKILITNPTGRIGRRIMPELLAPEFSVRVIVRDPTRLPAEIRQEAEVVRGSTDDAATLRRALGGVEALFWCVPTESLQETKEDLSYNQAAAVIERTLERPVRYLAASANQYLRTLVDSGASAEYARSVVEMFAELARGITHTDPRTTESTRSTTLGAWAESELRPAVESVRSQSETAAAARKSFKTVIHSNECLNLIRSEYERGTQRISPA